MLIPLVYAYCSIPFSLDGQFFQNNTLISSFNLTNQSNQYVAFFNNTYNNDTFSNKIIINLNCDKQKTFFIINQSQAIIDVKSNSTVNLNFWISPVIFGNYSIRGWGIFNHSQGIYLDKPYLFNKSYEFPILPYGKYSQVFEITNGYETQYVSYQFNNTYAPEPTIFKVEYPSKITYGKNYKVSVYGDNIDRIELGVGKNVWNVYNTSEYYFEGKIFTLEEVNQLNLKAINNYKTINKTYQISIEPLNVSIQNIIIPAIPLNQSTRILIYDFQTDYQIPINVSSRAIIPENQTQDFSYYIVNEDDIINPSSARRLYAIINTQSPIQRAIEVKVSSITFPSQSFNIEFVGSNYFNQPIMNITYYDKPTLCVLKGENFLNSKYSCTFELPINYDVEKLQMNEIALLKEGYEYKINLLEKENSSLKTQRLIVIIGIILLVIAIIFYLISKSVVVA